MRYAFRHALLQEAVTPPRRPATRRALHLRIAGARERAAPELARTEPDTRGQAPGGGGRARPGGLRTASTPGAWRWPGRRTWRLSISSRARSPTSRDGRTTTSRADFELDLRILLGNALISVRGYASLEVAECYARARELCRRIGDDARLLPVLYGLWVNAFVRARHERVLELGVELRELAERRDPGVLIVAERAVGWPLFCMGRFAEAREYLDRIPELHERAGGRPLHLLYGQDPAAAGLATGAWALWGCGDERGRRGAGGAGDRAGARHRAPADAHLRARHRRAARGVPRRPAGGRGPARSRRSR